MEFQLFDRVRVKSTNTESVHFTNGKAGWITGYNAGIDMYEVEFAAGAISARIHLHSTSLEKVDE
jgi:hypothetical protein